MCWRFWICCGRPAVRLPGRHLRLRPDRGPQRALPVRRPAGLLPPGLRTHRPRPPRLGSAPPGLRDLDALLSRGLELAWKGVGPSSGGSAAGCNNAAVTDDEIVAAVRERLRD